MARPAPIRVLFLNHAATRNGASILLLQTLKWLRGQVDWHFDILVNGRGPLLEEFQAIACTRVHRSPDAILDRLPWLAESPLRPHMQALYASTVLPGRTFDLIYANTAATWREVSLLGARAPALLWHIHEMAYALRWTLGAGQAAETLGRATRVVAVSDAVGATLSRDFGVAPEGIDVVHGFVGPADLSAGEREARRSRARQRLGWSESTFVVGGCGNPGWRKGTDLFVQIAKEMASTPAHENLRLLWVGGDAHGRENLEFEQDIRLAGLKDHCHLTPSTAEVSDWYCAMDVFALTSREDPYPLVMLEAAAHGLPMVCFEGSGGGPDFARHGTGLIAPYLDIRAFAAHLVTLHDSRQLRCRMGAQGLSMVQQHHVVETQGPKLLSSMQACMAATLSSRVEPQHAN